MNAKSFTALFLVLIIAFAALLYNFSSSSYTGRLAMVGQKHDCETKLNNYCYIWSVNGYAAGAASSKGRPGAWSTFAEGCTSLGIVPSIGMCEKIIEVRLSGS